MVRKKRGSHYRTWLRPTLVCVALLFAGARPPIATAGSPVEHHAVSNCNLAAQRLFDEGLTLVYAFNRDEATARFRKAAALDAGCAMAWWGVALAQGPNINVAMEPARNRIALDALKHARNLEGSASPRERSYVEALRARYGANPKNRAALDKAYMLAMKGVASSDPADTDAATLYAESIMDVTGSDHLYDARGRPAPLTPVLVATLASVLKRDPAHIGACHYYIHALDASGHPDRAATCARFLSSLDLEPAASHLTHMGSHIWMQTGQFAWLQRDAARTVLADESFARKHRVAVDSLDYYRHNLDFWAGAAIMRGRLADYRRIAKRYGTRSYPLYYLARLGRWDDILATPDPAAKEHGAPAYIDLSWRYARCLAFAAKKQPARTVAERDAFVAIEAALPADERPYFVIEGDVLDAQVADARGDRARSVTLYKAALSIADAEPMDNYPNWRFPLREWLGTMDLRDGQAASAERVFRDDLVRDPGNARSLFGLMLALAAQKSPEASSVERAYRSAWRDADAPLTLAQL